MSEQICFLNMFKTRTSVGRKLLRRRVFSASADSNKINSWLDYLDLLL